ncbi:MAG: prolyl oligopeptidase family serine peptidase [bacterium]|jgi:dienelactone hydrolase
MKYFVSVITLIFTIAFAGELSQPLCQSSDNLAETQRLPDELASFFQPPAEFAGDFGDYRSPLKFYDGRPVETVADWQQRRQEILRTWHGIMGEWLPLLDKPAIEYLEKEQVENFTRQKVKVEIAPDHRTIDGYLMIPLEGDEPFPAVIVVYYDPETGAGLGKELRDFGYQLAKRGFITLSVGMQASLYYPDESNAILQPLSALAYAAANCYNALAALPQVDPQRIGITGHSYGGKWAMFASCLYDKFACAAWSDGGIVFDESRSNVNYWEPWYLGYDRNVKRTRGVPTEENPRTGAYKELVSKGHDLHELHALMAPRPFLVSGGSEDHPGRWKALNHSIAVNTFLGYEHRVGMTNREGHSPTPESNEQIYLFFEHFLKNQSP